ncbi:hypothetical protein [Candidatus Enterovibrio escicola]|nr:hypothetical protein [Candidatus Enterovibrio escacola]
MILYEFEPKSMPVTAKLVGIDLGLKNLFITNIGKKKSISPAIQNTIKQTGIPTISTSQEKERQ